MWFDIVGKYTHALYPNSGQQKRWVSPEIVTSKGWRVIALVKGLLGTVSAI